MLLKETHICLAQIVAPAIKATISVMTKSLFAVLQRLYYDKTLYYLQILNYNLQALLPLLLQTIVFIIVLFPNA